MKTIFAGAALAILSVSEMSQAKDWECRDLLGSWDHVLLELKGDIESGSGQVASGDLVHSAQFSASGINRRWDFGPTEDKERFLYTIILEPNGSALYYEFISSKTVSPSQRFYCRKAR